MIIRLLITIIPNIYKLSKGRNIRISSGPLKAVDWYVSVIYYLNTDKFHLNMEQMIVLITLCLNWMGNDPTTSGFAVKALASFLWRWTLRRLANTSTLAGSRNTHVVRTRLYVCIHEWAGEWVHEWVTEWGDWIDEYTTKTIKHYINRLNIVSIIEYIICRESII